MFWFYFTTKTKAIYNYMLNDWIERSKNKLELTTQSTQFTMSLSPVEQNTLNRYHHTPWRRWFRDHRSMPYLIHWYRSIQRYHRRQAPFPHPLWFACVDESLLRVVASRPILWDGRSFDAHRNLWSYWKPDRRTGNWRFLCCHAVPNALLGLASSWTIVHIGRRQMVGRRSALSPYVDSGVVSFL